MNCSRKVPASWSRRHLTNGTDDAATSVVNASGYHSIIKLQHWRWFRRFFTLKGAPVLAFTFFAFESLFLARASWHLCAVLYTDTRSATAFSLRGYTAEVSRAGLPAHWASPPHCWQSLPRWCHPRAPQTRRCSWSGWSAGACCLLGRDWCFIFGGRGARNSWALSRGGNQTRGSRLNGETSGAVPHGYTLSMTSRRRRQGRPS